MFDSISDLIGNTPLVAARNLNPNKNVLLLFKLEGQNPGGSVKDRPALNMIREGLRLGHFDVNSKLIEATSGNTGIALAMVARNYGLDLELVMPENSTIERVQTMRAYGAKVTLTPADIGIEGARDYVIEKVQNEGYTMLDQFGNEHNWQAHYKTTGPEIWKDTQQGITHFVASMGTTGTITGTGTFLKEQNSNIQVIGVQPEEGAKIPGIRKWSEAYIPSIFNPKVVDDIMLVSQSEAEETAQRMAEEEGIFCGMSSGGCTAIALRLAAKLQSGMVVSIVCDRGDRYLSSGVFGN